MARRAVGAVDPVVLAAIAAANKAGSLQNQQPNSAVSVFICCIAFILLKLDRFEKKYLYNAVDGLLVQTGLKIRLSTVE